MKIKWNTQGFYDLRREPGVRADLEARAKRIADAAETKGRGVYATSSVQGKKKPQGRWRTTVITADAKAQAETAKHNTLHRSIDAGR